MPKMPKPKAPEVKEVKTIAGPIYPVAAAVDVLAVENEGDEIMGMLSMITEEGSYEFILNQAGAELLIAALENYVDRASGRPLRHPSRGMTAN